MAKLADDDPFGMFGEDDDDSVGDTRVYQLAQSMVIKANDHCCKKTVNAPINTERPVETDVAISDEVEFPWRRPLYLGPVKLVGSLDYGGGRGLVARKAIAPGTLILVEKPVLQWPWRDEPLGKELGLASIQHLLACDEAQRILHELEHLHPCKRVVDGDEQESEDDKRQISDMMGIFQSQYANEALLLVDMAKDLVNSDGSPLLQTDLLRLLLVLRYNGLESGIYLYVAMMNHADSPNCVKFLPAENKQYSEVRATRPIQAGEAVTISYLPRILSHASRRKHLREQHRFDIGLEPTTNVRMELIGGNRPGDEDVTLSVENTVAELRLLYSGCEASYNHSTDARELVKALEQSSLVLSDEAARQLQNDRHLLLIPCLELHIDSAHLVLRDPSLSLFQRMLLLTRMVSSSHKLLSLQSEFHGPDHFDLARTNLDLSQAIEELLVQSPKNLLELNMDGLQAIAAWSTLEYQTRREFARIRDLYPHDADERIAAYQD